MRPTGEKVESLPESILVALLPLIFCAPMLRATGNADKWNRIERSAGLPPALLCPRHLDCVDGALAHRHRRFLDRFRRLKMGPPENGA